MRMVGLLATTSLALAACATDAQREPITGPNGLPVYVIKGMDASTSLARAERLCPNGYTIVSDTLQQSARHHEMAIECKASSKEVAQAKIRTLTARRPGQPFGSWHFIGIEPNVTTREEVTEIFGQPSQSMAMGGELLDMWIERTQLVAVVFKDGKFARLQSIANVDIRPKDKAKLGL